MGPQKQDCETNAAKRLIGKIRRVHPRLPLIIVADSLYSTQPMMEAFASHEHALCPDGKA